MSVCFSFTFSYAIEESFSLYCVFYGMYTKYEILFLFLTVYQENFSFYKWKKWNALTKSHIVINKAFIQQTCYAIKELPHFIV